MSRPMQFEKKFYSNVKWLLVINVIVSIVVMLIGLLLDMRPIFAILFGSATLVLGSVTFVLARKFWPVYAGPDGLRTYDGMGINSDLPWNEILSANPALGYYWIRSASGKTLCVPTYLEDMEGFKNYVRHHAPVDNPLRESL